MRAMFHDTKHGLKSWRGKAELFKLDVPMRARRWRGYGPYTYYVVVSSVVAYSGPETYIFAADSRGLVKDMTELDGSFRGDKNIPQALENAGYVIDHFVPVNGKWRKQLRNHAKAFRLLYGSNRLPCACAKCGLQVATMGDHCCDCWAEEQDGYRETVDAYEAVLGDNPMDEAERSRALQADPGTQEFQERLRQRLREVQAVSRDDLALELDPLLDDRDDDAWPGWGL